VEKARYIWMDGSLVPWDDAQIHVLTHTLHYGLGAFEGIRCYDTVRGPAIFRHREHVDRLFNSAKIGGMTLPYTKDQIAQATRDLIRENEQKSVYIRPLVWFGDDRLGVNNIGITVHVMIASYVWGAYLGEEGLKRGIRACVSSYTRHHPNAMPTKAKVCGNYVNSQLAKVEAIQHGYDEALLLDVEGYVVEASGENLFIVENGRIVTPPIGSALGGITRDTLIRIALDDGIEVKEDRLVRDRLYTADEVFLTGTAAEVTPVREVDRRQVGSGGRGPIVERLQKKFFSVVRGEDPRYASWLDPIGVPAAKKA
jgi:branched-chain amino acid aminotransferase